MKQDIRDSITAAAALAYFPARLVPPRADAGHALVVAIDDLNGGATRTDIGHGRGRRSDVLKKALVAPEAADAGHLHRRCRVVYLLAAPAALYVDLGWGAHVIRRHEVIRMAAERCDDFLRGILQ